MNFAPTITRMFEDGTPASVLLVKPQPNERAYYESYGFELYEVYFDGEYISLCMAFEDEKPHGWVWIHRGGGVA